MKNYVSMLLCCILTIICLRGFSRDTPCSQLFEALLVPAPSLVGVCPVDLRLQTVHHLQLVHAAFPKHNIHENAFLRLNGPAKSVAKMKMISLPLTVSYDTNISKLSLANNRKSGFDTLSYQKYLSRDAIRYRCFENNNPTTKVVC